MKHFKFLLFPLLLLLWVSCGEENVIDVPNNIYTPTEQELPTVSIQLLDDPTINGLKVSFTPSENAASIEYAIGMEGEFPLFVSGDLETIKTPCDGTVEHKFDDLDLDGVYFIFARAYNQNDEHGPATSFMVRTYDGAFHVTTNFVGNESMAFKFYGYPEYITMEYALYTSATAADIERFENEEYDETLPYENRTNSMKNMKTDILANFTVSFYELEEETTYYLLFRGQDRYGNWTRTFVSDETTFAFDDVPAIKYSTDFSGFFITSMTSEPNAKVGKYYILKTVFDYEVLAQLWMAGSFPGDMMGYMATQAMAGTDVYSTEQTIVYPITSGQLGERFLTYILIYDTDGNPASVIKREWFTHMYDDGMGTAEVGVDITATTKGGKYKFTPNEHVEGFMFETFDASQLTDIQGKTDQEIKDYFKDMFTLYYGTYLNYNGGRFQYKFEPYEQFWQLEYTDEDNSGTYPSGHEFILAIFPMNGNGLEGIGEVTYHYFNQL